MWPELNDRMTFIALFHFTMFHNVTGTSATAGAAGASAAATAATNNTYEPA